MALVGQSGPAIGLLSQRLSGHQVATTFLVLVLAAFSPDSVPSKGPHLPQDSWILDGFWGDLCHRY